MEPSDLECGGPDLLALTLQAVREHGQLLAHGGRAGLMLLTEL